MNVIYTKHLQGHLENGSLFYGWRICAPVFTSLLSVCEFSAPVMCCQTNVWFWLYHLIVSLQGTLMLPYIPHCYHLPYLTMPVNFNHTQRHTAHAVAFKRKMLLNASEHYLGFTITFFLLQN